MTPRRRGESQRAWVGRVLRTEGAIATWDCLYNGRYEDGAPFSITRLAAIIWTLRHEDNLTIDESAEPGHLAVYTLRPSGHEALTAAVYEASRQAAYRRTREALDAVPTWAQGWTCASCGGPPASAPQEMLGGLGLASCDRCGQQRHFRKRAAA